MLGVNAHRPGGNRQLHRRPDGVQKAANVEDAAAILPLGVPLFKGH
jgi:hypothetical protein